MMLNTIKRSTWVERLRDESSAPIMDGHLAEEWKRDNPRKYEAGRALADLLREAFSWLRKMLSRRHSRGYIQSHAISNPTPSQIGALPAQPSFLTYSDLAIPAHWPTPEPIDEPAPFIGRIERTVLGWKFELLGDACEFQRNMSAFNLRCMTFWSPDPEMPYEVIFTEIFLYIAFPEGIAVN
jgi:hypothetical protein